MAKMRVPSCARLCLSVLSQAPAHLEGNLSISFQACFHPAGAGRILKVFSGEKLSNDLTRGGTSSVLPRSQPFINLPETMANTSGSRRWLAASRHGLPHRHRCVPLSLSLGQSLISPDREGGSRGAQPGGRSTRAHRRQPGWGGGGPPASRWCPSLPPGPRLALHLLLLCGLGALLSSLPVPMSDRELGDTIKELQFLSEELLKNYVQVSALWTSFPIHFFKMLPPPPPTPHPRRGDSPQAGSEACGHARKGWHQLDG